MKCRDHSSPRTQLSRREFLALSGAGVFNSSCSPDSTGSKAGTEPLHFAGLTEVASLIKSKDLSPVELTQMMLDRIENVDPRLKSYATVMAD